jgi:hypothetical protein
LGKIREDQIEISILSAIYQQQFVSNEDPDSLQDRFTFPIKSEREMEEIEEQLEDNAVFNSMVSISHIYLLLKSVFSQILKHPILFLECIMTL